MTIESNRQTMAAPATMPRSQSAVLSYIPSNTMSAHERNCMKLETPKWTEIGTWWPAIEKWVAKALEHGGVTLYPIDVYNGLASRNMKLWLALDGNVLKGCCITRVVNYPRLKSLDILILSGEDMHEWLHFYKQIEDYARATDCDAVEFYGRKGLEKPMSGYGFGPVITIFRKAL